MRNTCGVLIANQIVTVQVLEAELVEVRLRQAQPTAGLLHQISLSVEVNRGQPGWRLSRT